MDNPATTQDGHQADDDHSTSVDNLSAVARAARAAQLRASGLTWDAIAAECGYANKSNAYRAVKSHFDEMPAFEVDDLRRLWDERVETLWRIAYMDALKGKAGAVTAAVRVAERAARLHGLDEPAELSINPSTRELEEWVAQIAEHEMAWLPVEADVIDGELAGELDDPGE
ncbi:hypothetical protein [Jiangella asiatica]|uniref:Uncharacterized protein n=1 Tax=Jiangella asiatica TaxID=2530372 RepID=A0A4R5DAJ3_9ACTN|nr:hypothetical protein [Jiangella asiatica]TDE10662.1 hypothetical protein E1269_11350 [Jiangella asiatica]